MNAIEQYIHDRDEQVSKNKDDAILQNGVHSFTEHLVRTNYIKNFTWMGIPILQYPSDLMVMQELIWEVKPDYIIETGVAFGGMTLFYAHMLDAIGKGKVLGIDIEIREHTKAIIKHPRIELKELSSIDPNLLKTIKCLTENKTVLVSLDSNHNHAHVLCELKLYAPLISVGSYIIAYDTAIDFFGYLDKNKDQRPWGPGNSPYTAVQQFLKETDDFTVDKEIEQRVLITAAPGGYLKRVK